MGTGRDKRKKFKERKDGPVASTGHVKTEKKTNKNEAKKERRATKRLEGDEDDIDALLLRLALEEQAKKGSVQVVADCEPPGPRVSASFLPYVTPRGSSLLLFGGEYANLQTDKVRCGQAALVADRRPQRPAAPLRAPVVTKNTMLVFGGEFTSPNQERFHHYKDLWRLDLTTWEWDSLPTKGGPSARSGHRMALQQVKNRVLLFGGFYDTGRDVKYYNDLWELNLETLKWASLGPGAGAGAWPSPRSGCGLAVVGDTLWVFGGYSKTKDDEDPDLERGKTMDDVWACNLSTYTWERVKKQGFAPGARASFSLALHAHPKAGPRAFLFGGVSDNEAKGGEDLSSEFHNDLFNFNFERRRWYVAELKPPPGAKGGAAAAAAPAGAADATAAAQGLEKEGGEGRDVGVAGPDAAARLAAVSVDKTSALYRAAVKIQASYRGYVVRKAYQTYRIGGVVSEILYSPAAYGLDLSVLNMPKPRSRIGALAAVVGSQLWLLGGTVEVGSKEVTLDDMWVLDAVKLDGWQLVRENTVGEELLKKGGDGDSSDWTEASGDEDDDSEEESEEEAAAPAKGKGKAAAAAAPPAKKK